MANKRVFTGTGRRKTSVAQVKMVPGNGSIKVNGVDVNEFMPYEIRVSRTGNQISITPINNFVIEYK